MTPSDPTELPCDVAAERIVVGACINSRRAVEEVCALGLHPEDFARVAHATIFETARAMVDEGLPIEPVAVHDALVKQGNAVRVGGAPYLHTLTESVPVLGNALYYARIVIDRARLRRIALAAHGVWDLARAGDVAADDVAERAHTVMDQATAATSDSAATHLADLLPEVFDDLQRPLTSDDIVPAPYRQLDTQLSGLRPGQLITVAGRPGMGKTTFGLDAARTTAIRAGLPAIVFSLEMSRHELAHRVLAAESRVSLAAITRHELTDADWERLAAARIRLAEAPLLIDDTPQASLAHIRARLRGMARTRPARLVVVDYLQLMPSGQRAESRQQEVSEISRSLKLLAKEFRVPIILAAQLNRGPEQRADKRPLPSDLRESGAVEQDSDVVLLLYRDEVYDPETARAGEQDIIIGKNRSGAPGTVTVAYQGHYARAVDMAVR